MKQPAMRVLVTGGAGFIGSHTVDYLLAQGAKVTVLDDLSTGKKENLELFHRNLTFIEGDVRDLRIVKQALKNVTHVLHLAAKTSGTDSVIHPRESFHINVCGFVNIINSLYEIRPTARFIYASSAAIYGDTKKMPCTEQHGMVAQPLTPYALGKRYDEECADLFQRLYKMPTLGLRYFNVYGPRQDLHSPYSGVISQFVCAISDKKKIKVYGDGRQTRDFIFVEDVARANYLALTSDSLGVVNIGTGQKTSLLQLIKILEVLLKEKFNIQFKPLRKGDILHSLADVQSAKKYLGFESEYSMKQGLKCLIENIICE